MLSVWLAVVAALGSPVPAGRDHQPYRLSEKTGDTIDVAERDKYHLFPGIPDFQSAVVFVGDSFDYRDEITSGNRDTARVWTGRLMPTEVERIRFIIENPEHIEQELATNKYAGKVMDRFWADIESRLVLKENVKTVVRPGTAEARLSRAAAGVTVGSCLGGAVGAATSTKLVSSEELSRSPTCLGCLYGKTQCGTDQCGMPYECENYTVFTYSMNPGKFALVSGAVMGACATGGFFTGLALDRRPQPEPLPNERQTWRQSLSVLFGVSGVALGFLATKLSESSLYGRWGQGGNLGYDQYILENRPWVADAPAIITGVGVAVESYYIGYVIGRSLDRRACRPRAERPSPRDGRNVFPRLPQPTPCR
jgi:hypothetical protein